MTIERALIMPQSSEFPYGRGLDASASSKNDWDGHFADHYYREYYLPDEKGEIPTDEQFTLERNTWALRMAHLPTDRSLEALVIGTGPTLDDALILTPYAAHIDVSDYSAGSREQVRQWVNGDPQAHDWGPYAKYILGYEGRDASDEAVAVRENDLRRKIRRIMHVDAMKPDPVGPEGRRRYDIVVVPYCFDSAVDNEKDWRTMVNNGLSTAKPGALILMAALRNCRSYIVGGRPYPAANINEGHIAKAFSALDIPSMNTTIEVGHFPEHAPLGYTSVVVASARMPLVRK